MLSRNGGSYQSALRKIPEQRRSILQHGGSLKTSTPMQCLGFLLWVKPSAQRLYFLKKELQLLKPTGHVMHQQFNIQQLYALPTLYLCVLYLSENKQ